MNATSSVASLTPLQETTILAPLAARGVTISYRSYVAIGVPVTLVALILAVWTLNLELAIAKRFLGLE